ncbi:MAG: hypothetical protein AAB420_02570 [Patescibacteria group bacterium]
MKHSYGPLLAFVALIAISGWYINGNIDASLTDSQARQEAASTTRMEAWERYEKLVAEGSIPSAQPVLDFQFEERSDRVPALTLEQMIEKYGYPSEAPPTASYVIRLLDSDRVVLYEQPFSSFPGHFSVTIPWLSDAIYVGIFDHDGVIIVFQPLARVPFDDSPPSIEKFLSHP